VEYADGSEGDGIIKWRSKTRERDFWHAYLRVIKALKIVDPACGSGAFLIAAFDFLKGEQEHVRSRLLELEPGLLVFAAETADVEIITQNLYGVDVNAESIEITKLALWLKTAKRGRQLESLDRTVRIGNSLIEDADYHRRAFVWRNAFPEVFPEGGFDQGGFDIVIGNPP
jgi:type I restriction-modification system DNA methylase subunit